MRKFLFAVALSVCSLAAQTVESVPFRALLSPANEVPAIANLNASGTATVWLHVMRDAAGQVVSGSVDFDVRYDFPGAVNITGMHIHRGAAGVNGPVTIGAIGGAAGPAVADSTGRGSLQRQAQVPATAADALDTIRGMLQDPGGYYVNLHTEVNPGGVIRGQLVRAERLKLFAPLSSRNEMPALADLNASGFAAVTVLATRAGNGTITSAEVRFDASYRFPSDVTLTGFHIHAGGPAVNGPVTINTGLTSQPSAGGGAGALSYTVEVPVTNQSALNTLYGLFEDPGEFYVNLHTTVYPAGAIRGQLRAVDAATFQVAMSPANEVPAVTGLNASGAAQVTVETIRNADGSVSAGVVTFDVNYRFPDAVEFTGMHIHDQVAGQNGSVTIGTSLSAANAVASETGFGNVYRTVLVTEGTALASLNSVVQNPEKHYINLHSRVNPGGVIRAQLAPANAAAPAVADILSAVSDPTLRTVAPGGLMTLFGVNLTKVPGSAQGLTGGDAPLALNGTEVTVGGVKAPVVLLAAGFAVVQVPVETKAGAQTVTVRNANGLTASRPVQVAGAAPALYFDAVAGIAFRVTDLSLIRPDNPAFPGEPIALFATGLGLTDPALETGKSVPESPFYTTTMAVSATFGGRPALVLGAAAVPGFLGQYLVLAQVPATASGSQAVILRMGEATSNTVQIPIR
ncbi:MAG: CHRD domain-containing protein [Acidobacteria bacterium]|nr:CHRD domain-containing protein [Acidobacteriota bacterium]